MDFFVPPVNSCHVLRIKEIQASTSWLLASNLPPSQIQVSRVLVHLHLRTFHLPVHPPTVNTPFYRKDRKKRNTESEEPGNISLQLHPPANLNHCGTELFLPGLAESSAF
ncbi:hypothetical protein ILYODFUR_026361 [Ilyodon furcidens]|uniref:Uncharacterized protein n=1 Tax=Ilyodon furcidens TaxID=33524 RepID=A0ABV0TXV3_9TELE